MRLLLWIVAVPLSFLLVFLVARAFGVFTTNQLSDVFLANNTGRFWPVARLLPFVALVTAALVQGGVYLLARLRGAAAAEPRGDDRTPSSRAPVTGAAEGRVASGAHRRRAGARAGAARRGTSRPSRPRAGGRT